MVDAPSPHFSPDHKPAGPATKPAGPAGPATKPAPDVGRSIRTPGKLEMLRAYAGREIGAAKDVARRCAMPYRNHVFADLTAGDGVAHSGTLWTRGCSPGIFAHLAADGKRP